MKSAFRITNSFLALLYLLTLCLPALILVLFYLQESREKSTYALVQHTQKVLSNTSEILIDILDNETNSREFFLTGQAVFLEPFLQSKKTIGLRMDTLRKLTEDNSRQQLWIDSLAMYINKRFIFSDSIVKERQTNGLNSVAYIVSSGRGKFLTDKIRAVIQIIENEEAGLLKQRTLATEQSARHMQVIKQVSISAMILLLMVFIIREKLQAGEAKKANVTLNTNEELFSLMVSNVKDYAIFMLDDKGKVASWNAGAEHIKGYTKEEIMGKSLETFYTRADIEKGEPFHNLEMARKLGHYEQEGWRLRKDGSLFYANVVFTALNDKAGKLYGYSKITRNITEKKREELIRENFNKQLIASHKRIEESETRFRSIVEQAFNPILILKGEELTLELANDAVFKIWGVNKEALGKPFLQILPEMKDQSFLGLLKDVLHNGTIHTGQEQPAVFIRENGQTETAYFNFVYLPYRDIDKGISGVLAQGTDVTAQVLASKEMQKNIEKVTTLANIAGKALAEKNNILESIGDAFFAVDKDWTVTYWNRVAAVELQVLKETIMHHNLWEIFPKSIGSRSYQCYHQAMQTRQPVTFETYFEPLNKWYEISAFPSESGLSVYFKNISQWKQLEDKMKNLNTELERKVNQRTLELKKANDDLESFSYSVSHDLRAPLRNIIGFASMLEEDYAKELDMEARRITGIIKKNTTKMGNLIDDLLSFSRFRRQELLKTPVNMNDLVEEVIQETDIRDTLIETITWDIHELPMCFADKTTIRQVWVNLISNAVKYSGKVTNPKIEIGAQTQKEKNIFYVKDNGAGFDQKYKDKLFKVFQRLHTRQDFEGTGIGLAIVEKIITKHGGEVWANAEPGLGATFYFSLPLNIATMDHKRNT